MSYEDLDDSHAIVLDAKQCHPKLLLRDVPSSVIKLNADGIFESGRVDAHELHF
jgi:hypothetical protein